MPTTQQKPQLIQSMLEAAGSAFYNSIGNPTTQFTDTLNILKDRVQTAVNLVLDPNSEDFKSIKDQVKGALKQALEPVVDIFIDLAKADNKTAFVITQLSKAYLQSLMEPMKAVGDKMQAYQQTVDDIFQEVLTDIKTKLDGVTAGHTIYYLELPVDSSGAA